MELTKICGTCKIEKSINLFNDHKKHKSGKQYWCKDCEHKSKNIYDANKRIKILQEALDTRINLKDEIWLSIDGYEGLYEVSNMGRIYSLKYRTVMFQTTKKRIGDDYICKTIKLQKGTHIKGFKVHRLVALAFIPNPEDKPEIDHKDNNASNNMHTNLQWATRGEQIRWAYERGRDRKGGEKAHTSKLTNIQVKELRDKYKSGVRFFELKKQYPISESSLSNIIKYRTYKDAI